jgi:type VI secretion system protein ImpJ
VWTEGLFLKPQHLQQERRYFEHALHARSRSIRGYGWGFTSIELDRDLLAIGKLGIARAEGVFPDGTAFVLPADDVTPQPLDIDAETKAMQCYLCIPVHATGQQEIHFDTGESGLTRYAIRELDIRDEASSQVSNTTLVQVAPVKPELRLKSQELEGYTTLGLALIVERQGDGQVVIDEEYIPPMLHSASQPGLKGMLNEVSGLLKHRGDELAGRVALSGQGGAAEVSDFLLLQTVNRYQPVVAHLATAQGIHPEEIHRLFLEIAGELATFTTDGKRPPEFAEYDHDDLRTTLDAVLGEIRTSLSMILEQRAIKIQLEEHQPGRLYSGILGDTTLVDTALFVIGVAADAPAEDVRQHFPGLAKVAAREELQEIVSKLLPGIPIRALPVAPRQIPYHAGNIYFELDSKSKLCQGLKKTGSIAIHLGRDFPGLQLELWAIKSN